MVEQPEPHIAAYPPHLPAQMSSNPYSKTPGLAALLSIVPGLGNIYNGLYLRGVAFFLTYVSLFSLAVNSGHGRDNEGELAFLVPTMLFFWCFNIFDAYRQATLINHAAAHGSLPAMSPFQDKLPNAGSLVPGVLVFVVGLYGLLRRYLDIDLAWIIDLWPFLLMAFGGFLIWQHLKSRGDASAPGELASDEES
jgi:hypothetical protein